MSDATNMKTIQVKLLLILVINLFAANVQCSFLGQECSLLANHPTHPCVSIRNWYDLDFVVKTTRGIEYKQLCPFDIQMPDHSEPLVLTRQVILVCAKVGKCIIRASENEDKPILRLKDFAKVTLHGFAFFSSGISFDRSSAVHITFTSILRQTFCYCMFDGFSGESRGTALRSEPRTKVDLVGCTFKNNSSLDLGTIFNRGSMNVTACRFFDNYGRGCAIGSSTGSLTVLQGNSFTNNRNATPIFFHGNNFVDSGRNVAQNNDICNGIFIDKGNQCLSFTVNTQATLPSIPEVPSKKDSFPLSQPNPFEHKNTCTMFQTGRISSCISIGTFNEFKNHVQGSQGLLVFCPFKISNIPLQSVDIVNSVQLICLVPGGCQIIGGKRHLRVIGPSAQLMIQGFVFKRASVAAVHILSNAPLLQCIIRCGFVRNRGEGRGVGLLADRNTITLVKSCRFKQNRSNDIGGSLFNRGEMLIAHASFVENIGIGGAIGNAPRAPLYLWNNTLERNSRGFAVFVHDNTFTDLGQNKAQSNQCNGVWIDRGVRDCVQFLHEPNLSANKQSVTSPVASNWTFDGATTSAPVGGLGYFNYNETDLVYGPNGGWGDVRYNVEYLRYEEMSQTLKRPLVNKCNWRNVNQSPIDLCEDKITNDCDEYHQTRSHSGNIKLGDEHVKAQILPTKLRLKYYPDRPPVEGPFPPELDYANNWNGFAEVNHIDIKIPSEHTICGKQYPAEYSIYVLHPGRRQTIVMSILLTLHENDKDNDHLQLAINEWQKEYDRNTLQCNNTEHLQQMTDADSNSSKSSNASIIEMNTSPKFGNETQRALADKTPFGIGGWDPFHPSLERSIYHWGYYGSLTEPPCSTFVAWRVLTEPAYVSTRQLNQMKNILFTHRDGSCNYTSVSYQESVARPIQPNRGRLIHKCTVEDYVSDEEKAAMREKTGNPNWCC